MTISSAEGSVSIFTSRNSTPRSFRKDFARRQSGHQLVVYMVTIPIEVSKSIGCRKMAGVAEDARDAARNIYKPGSAGFHGSASILARHLDSNDCALESDKGAVPIDIRITRGQAFFCASFGGLRAGKVNFRRALGGFRENGDAVDRKSTR